MKFLIHLPFRTSETTNFRIENVTEVGATGDVLSAKDTLTVSYEIENLEEYSTEDRKVSTEEVNYEPIETSRNIVFWDLSKIILIYRTDFKNKTELIGYSDYFVETRQKEYRTA